MGLPDPLPTNPDELEKLYESLIERDGYAQEDFDRLMEARLRAWGIDPETMTADQLIAVMQESMNRMLINLQMAMDHAPDPGSAAQLTEVIKMAENLRTTIDKAMDDAKKPEDG